MSVIARRPEPLAAVPQIRPLALDYGEDTSLAGALRQAIAEAGPITLAACWIHNTAPNRMVGSERVCLLRNGLGLL